MKEKEKAVSAAVGRFYDSTIGKKAVMAATGLLLFGYLVIHMLGNLQVYLGRDTMDHYAAALHANAPLLWTARTVLLVSVVLHIWASIQLSAIKRAARPIRYVKRGNVRAGYASRTMMLSGPLVAAFVVYHLLHLTTGALHPQFVELHAYENVVNGFRQPAAAVAYIFAMILVGMHLSHGIWSMFQSAGFTHPRYSPLVRGFASIFSWILVAGFISVPIAVLIGVLGS